MASSLYKVARSYGSSRLNQIARRSTSSEAGSEVKNPHSSQDSYGEHIIPSKEPTVLACDSQVKQFREDGFVSIQELTSKEEVVQLREMYDYWFKNMVGREHGNFFDLAGTDEDGKVLSSPQMLWPSKYGLNLADSQLYANALAISKQLLGDETTFKGDHAICKAGSPASRPTPWHQDEAYWDNATNYEALGVWLALQPVTVEQGCMCFIPKSHRMGIFDHTSLDNNPKIHALQLLKETDHVKESEIVPIPLPAGGATFHHSKLLHYTGANTVEGSTRRAYTMSFQGSAEPLATPRDYPWAQKETLRAKRASETGWDTRAP